LVVVCSLNIRIIVSAVSLCQLFINELSVFLLVPELPLLRNWRLSGCWVLWRNTYLTLHGRTVWQVVRKLPAILSLNWR